MKAKIAKKVANHMVKAARVRAKQVHRFRWPLALIMFALATQVAVASGVPVMSGSYRVVRTKNLGGQTEVQMQVHLVNRGKSALAIRRITIWDFAHPSNGGSRACSFTVGAHGSADTLQQFTVTPSEYGLWRRGLRPRIVLELPNGSPRGGNSKLAVRLDRTPLQEAKR